ncbi:MAG: SpoIIE family protein phosphatase [Sphingobacteriaceae bacterium]|nr:SpoIIE family protein phosphatase [Sphingobacteriaceae bacterium]
MFSKKLSQIFILFITLLSVSFSAQNLDDSLANILENENNDSLKIFRLTQLARNNRQSTAFALDVAAKTLLIVEKINNPKLEAIGYRRIGIIYSDIGNYDKAIEYTYSSIKIMSKLNDKHGLASAYNNIANYYNRKGNLTGDTISIKRAIDYHFKNINLRKEINDTTWLYISYNNASGPFINLKKYDEAIEILNLSYAYMVNRKEMEGSLRMVMDNLADAYMGKAEMMSKPEYLRKAQSYLTDIITRYKIENNTTNLNYGVALEKIGVIYFKTGQYERSLESLLSAYEIGKSFNEHELLSSSALHLAKLFELKNDYKKSNEYFRLHVAYKDTALNNINKSNLEQMQMIYQSNQKDNQIEKLKTDQVLQKAQLSKQRTFTLATVGGLALLLVIGFVLAKSYYSKRKANLKLTLAYNNIESKNKLITESIHYAKRLQSAILPPLGLLEDNFKNFFLFYAPKDIVSGDFYWFTKHRNKKYFAVADCTGHGVPGALMSMIGNTILHEIIDQKNIEEPGKILHQLNKKITSALRQQNADIFSQDDGMDISLICIEEHNKITYASANHSIFLKTENRVQELKGDIYSIGGSLGNSEKEYNTYELNASPGDVIILSSDGYADQFGGEKNSKFLVSRLEEKIKIINFIKPGSEKEFEKIFNDWKGIHPQTDDILITGFTV